MAAMRNNENPPNSLLLKNASAILPKGVSETSILIQEGLIKAVVDSPAGVAFASEDSTIDLKGFTLYPGFIDVHIHGAVGVDTMAATADDLIRVSKFLAAQGITGWMPTLVPAPLEDYRRAVSAIAQAMMAQEGSGILGVHYEGPFVNSNQCGALRSDFFRKFLGPADLDDLPLVNTPDAQHMMTVAPEIEGGIELTRELTNRGWIVSIGHTRADFGVLDEALRAGAAHMTHFMNAMSPFHHRSPGPVGWGLLRDEVTCDVIADGVHLDPTTLQLLIKTKGVPRLSLISDAIAAAGLGDGKYHIWNEQIVVKDGRTQNSRGRIAGSVITMLDAVAMVKSLGVSPLEVSQMASGNPARLLGVYGECGSIEEGKRADLIALDADGKVRLTVVGGRVVYQGET